MPKIKNRCVEVKEGGVGEKGWKKGDKGGRQKMGIKTVAKGGKEKR